MFPYLLAAATGAGADVNGMLRGLSAETYAEWQAVDRIVGLTAFLERDRREAWKLARFANATKGKGGRELKIDDFAVRPPRRFGVPDPAGAAEKVKAIFMALVNAGKRKKE